VLFRSKVISKEEYDASYATFKKAQEEMTNSQDALDIVRKGVAERYAFC
jgi:hypothetical protein